MDEVSAGTRTIHYRVPRRSRRGATGQAKRRRLSEGHTPPFRLFLGPPNASVAVQIIKERAFAIYCFNIHPEKKAASQSCATSAASNPSEFTLSKALQRCRKSVFEESAGRFSSVKFFPQKDKGLNGTICWSQI